MIIVLFRSKLTAAAGDDYAQMAQAMKAHALNFEGFIDIKAYTADDGERMTIVRWKDLETLKPWSEDMKHQAAKRLGREKWYQYYRIEIATLVDERSFVRPDAADAPQPARA